jgi:COMPASS component BRE2
MLAETDDPLADAVPIRVDLTPLVAAAAAAAPSSSASSRKRKHASQGSPAPEATLPARQIARGPLEPAFVPAAEGSAYCTVEHVVLNHNGFRYAPAAGAPPGAALAVRTGESTPRAYRASWEDRNPAVRVTPDGLGLCGADGFRSVRGNAPLRAGRWYMEVLVEEGGGSRPPDADPARAQGAHVRLGWARREAALGGPAGMDGYAYAYRDATGEAVTLSRPRPYGRAFGAGDVVGLYISLPPLRAPDPADPADPAHLHRERIAIQVGKEHAYFESKEYPVSKEMRVLLDKGELPAPEPPTPAAGAKKKGGGPRARAAKAPKPPPAARTLPTLPGSACAFFVNGACQGAAFRDLLDFVPLRAARGGDGGGGRKRAARRDGLQAHRDNPFDDGSLGYYPLVSLFNGARVRLNPGPDFAHPPPPDVDALLDGRPGGTERTWRPVCERYAEYVAEQAALDEQDEARAQALVADAARVDARAAQAKARKKPKFAPQERYAPSPLRQLAASPAPTDSSAGVDDELLARLVDEELEGAEAREDERLPDDERLPE